MEEKKNIEEMNERELLAELIRLQAKSSKSGKILVAIMSVIVAIVIATAIIVLPPALRILNETNTLVTSAEQTIGEVDVMIKGIQNVTGGISELVEDNREAVTESVLKLKDIDIESLNKSIKEFADVLEPLANFFNLWK